MCDIVKTRCRLSVDRKTSKHVNLKTYAVFLSVFLKTNLKTYAVFLSVFLVLKMKKTFLCTSYDKKFTKSLQKVYEKFTKSLQKVYKKFIIRSIFEHLLESIKKRRRFRVLRTTKGVRKMYKRCTKNAQKD